MSNKTQAAVARFEPRSKSQGLAQRLYSSCDLLFFVGPAGTGKSHAAVALAACDVLSDSPRNRLVMLRPAVQSDRELGFLPGELGEKLDPYTQPVRQILKKAAFNFPPQSVSYEALGYCRGLTYESSVVVVDEAQNAGYQQLLMVLTRLGKDSKMVLTGDPDQADIRSSGAFATDLDEVIDRLSSVKGVGLVEFQANESLRHGLVSQVLKKLTPR